MLGKEKETAVTKAVVVVKKDRRLESDCLYDAESSARVD